MSTAKEKVVKAQGWTRAHPFLATVAGFLVGVLIGVSSGASGKAHLHDRLAASQQKLNSLSASSQSEIDSLNSDNDSLSSKNSSLKARVAKLNSQITRLNAQRRLPSLIGSTAADARKLESAYGWNLTVKYRYSSSKVGTVLSQDPPPGTMMSYNAPFSVVAAKAIPKVPAVVGSKVGSATKTLKSAGYSVQTVSQISSQSPGTVISMSPSGGSHVIPGQTITLTVAKKAPPAPKPQTPTVSTNCTPGYSPCLPPASDYDCIGGSGDGPEYTGYVTVTGSDPYGLDADGDGVGCE